MITFRTYQFTCSDCGHVKYIVCFPKICIACECGGLMFIETYKEE
jgi:hypothetical protein